MPLLRTGRLLFALSGLAAFAVAVTGTLLLWRYREATLAAAADRQAVVVRARAHALGDEIGALVREMDRLSRLADVDLADGNLEPEKTVLRLARRDSALFSASIVILNSRGELVWAEPRDTRPSIQGNQLLALARDRGRAAVACANHELDVTAPIAGRGVIVGVVNDRGRDLFGLEIRRAFGEHGSVSLVLPRAGQEDIVMATAHVGASSPPSALTVPGQRWERDARGDRWFVTVAAVQDTALLLRLVVAADEVEGELSTPFRRLVMLVVGLLALAVIGGFALAALAHRLERTELELARSQELAAMGKTSAAIAHEVKNALNGLSVAVDLLATHRAEPVVEQAVCERARAEIARLREVADDLTLFAAIPHLIPSAVDLETLLRRAVDGVRELADDFHVELDLEPLRESLPIIADEGKLLGALLNLFRNGIEAMGPGAFGERIGEVVPVRERRLLVRAGRDDRRAWVEVADRGPGLPSEVRARLFEPFVTTKRTGTGLGLAIVRKVVEAHGGSIAGYDRPGGGTIFRMTLPWTEERA